MDTMDVKLIAPYMVTDEDLTTQTTYVGSSSTIEHPSDITTNDIMNVIEASGSLDFWNDPEEDKYGENDSDG